MKKLLAAMSVIMTVMGATNAPDSCAQVAAYPARQPMIIVPYTGGGIVDVIARVTAQALGPALSTTLIVSPKAGGNTVVGTEEVTRAAPDGYTLLFTATALAANASLLRHAPYDASKDLRAVALVAYAPNIAVVAPGNPADTLKAFVARRKEQTGRDVLYGTAGSGSTQHLGFELFRHVAGLKAQQVPYQGQPQAVPDLIRGDIDIMFMSATLALPQVKAGKLKALAVISPARLGDLPDVPTIAEAGYPEVDAAPWFALFAPARTPDAVVDMLNEKIGSLLGTDSFQASLRAVGALPAKPQSPAATQAFFADDVKRWRKVIADGRIPPLD